MKHIKNISVLGCGRWGSFIAWYLNKIGLPVTLWGREGSSRFRALAETRKTALLSLEKDIVLTNELSRALESDTLIISISSQQLRGFLRQLSAFPLEGKRLVLCMKGLEISSGKRLSEVACEELAGKGVSVAIWVGPGHVQDFVCGIPNCMVIDSSEDEVKRTLVKAFSSDLIRFYYGTDLIGNEVGAAAKNVVGIAAGMLDGMGRSSLKGALMSRGTREISRLIDAMGGNALSAYGLAHLGDYEATLFSPHSHNRRFGELFVCGKPYKELAEGVSTSEAIVSLAVRYGVELPICRAIYAIVSGKESPERTLSNLFLRSIKDEF